MDKDTCIALHSKNLFQYWVTEILELLWQFYLVEYLVNRSRYRTETLGILLFWPSLGTFFEWIRKHKGITEWKYNLNWLRESPRTLNLISVHCPTVNAILELATYIVSTVIIINFSIYFCTIFEFLLCF